MAFDKDTRHLLAKTVAACRRRLTEDVTDQLRGVFGMHPDGTVLPLEKMAHLSPDQAAAARRLRDLLDHFTAGEAGKEQDRRKAAYERMTLEISFTILNRLAALRLCEERGLVVECVRKGTASDGFRLFERISGGALGGRYAAYRVFIECLFDELALDLGVLFDRMTPQSTVFPTERCMEDVLAELNKAELTHLWTEDETIGWVYQYFNPPEERKAMREASQAPRNSRELAVRNQFFTPRYVVEFLSDNTLGRIWYEMRKGKTALKDECLYLVRRPNEVFLASGEKTPAKPESETDLSQEELLKKTVHIEHRPKKDPREIKILDPACGSGHFLLYAFDLLEHIYEEAWADADGPKFEAAGRTLRENFETLDDLRRAVPKLIIEHNLHGIDIDTRAVQIAALALWLRAQKAWKNLSLKVAERPQVTKSNIVVAEPMPGEEGMRNEFVESLKPRVLGQLVDVVFEKMMLAGEAGSLLKIEEEIKDAVVEAKKQWLKRPKDEQAVLFEELKKPKAAQTEMQFDFTGVTDEEFWEQAEDRILDALKEYSEQAENGRAIRRRLFAEDAARGFAFMDLCRKRFDVVLMNPPFGEFSDGSVDYIMSRYPDSRQDIFAAFVERCVTDFCSNGYTGVLSKESGFFLRTLKNWRRSVLLGRTTMSAMIHLGGHVLDGATVRTSAYVLRTPNEKLTSVFIRLLGKDDREARLLRKLDAISGSLGDRDVYITPQTEFEKLPFGVFGYWCSAELRNSFTALPSLEDRGGSVRVGLQTSDDFRFLRLRFEVSPGLIESHKWYPYAKGGEYRPFHDDIHLVTQFPTEGSALAEFPKVVVRNSIDYFKPGLTYPPRTNKRFAPRVLPAGCIFGQKGPAVVDIAGSAWSLLAFLNSRTVSYMLSLSNGMSEAEGGAGANSYDVGTVQRLPYPPGAEWNFELTELGKSAWRSQSTEDRFNETTISFRAPSLAGHHNSFSGYSQELSRLEKVRTEEYVESQCEIDRVVRELYCLSDSDWDAVMQEVGEVHSPTVLPADSQSRHTILTCSLMSYCVGCIFGRWDVRIALDPSCAPKMPDPFDPLPACPPGMLVGPDGLPAEPGGIVSEEWLRARPDANTLPPESAVKNPSISDADYPLCISWDGILVDNPGFNGGQPHRNDIVSRVREVLDLLWKDKAHEIEQEACDILGVSNLRDYFRKPSGFFQDHLKRYSKSRRKAPIYWPLSTASGSYTVWLYYHRLNDQTLYAAVNKYVEPKIAEVERGITRIENELKSASGRNATQLRDRLNEGRTFLSELRDLREELLRVAALPYKPNLNDGVIINAAPLHKLFRLRSWAKDTENCWKKLEKGDYDWAHLAYTIWPDRVRDVCKKDRSIAIAHGLEELCEVEASKPDKKRGRSKKI